MTSREKTGIMKNLAPLLALLLTVGLLPRSANAQEQRGYIDLSQVEAWFDDEPAIEVNIRGALLNLVAEASKYEDPDLADMLRQLKVIQVRGFDLSRADDTLLSQSTELGRQLEADGWETVVRVRDDGEHVQMYLLATGESIDGMVVLATDEFEDEAIFVNIVGEIRPDQIGRIGRKFNLGVLESN